MQHVYADDKLSKKEELTSFEIAYDDIFDELREASEARICADWGHISSPTASVDVRFGFSRQ